MVMQFKQCCCGCSLRAGSVMIGILFAVGALLTLIGCIAGASAFSQAGDDTLKNSTSTNSGGGKDAVVVEVFLIVYAVVSAIRLLFSILLIFGASAEKRALLKPWIIAEIINAVVTGITNVIQIIIVFAAGGVALGFILLVLYALIMCILVYFILVVNSLHTELSIPPFNVKT